MRIARYLIVGAAIGALLVIGCGKKKAKEKPIEKPPASKIVDSKPPPTAQAATGTTQAVVAHHLDAFGKADMDALLSDYADDAVMVTPMGTLTGPEQLKGMFTVVFEEFAKPGMKFEMGKQEFAGEIGFITWTAETADNTYELGTDTFVVQEGKIVAQTFAAKMTPKAPPPKNNKADRAEAEPPAAPSGPSFDVVNHHLEAFGKGDMDAILSDYNADSFMLTPMGAIKGAEGLKGLFSGLLAEFAKPGAKFEMGNLAVAGEIVQIVWTARTADNVYSFGTDTFVVREGKIVAQTFAAVIEPNTAE